MASRGELEKRVFALQRLLLTQTMNDFYNAVTSHDPSSTEHLRALLNTIGEMKKGFDNLADAYDDLFEKYQRLGSTLGSRTFLGRS